ncbi:transposase [Actinokineospora spheciospongiae]|uniref:transposase n=1 Tax=Actinokineospora spheciospongiae TaxID=909613 RepID=UPI003899520C
MDGPRPRSVRGTGRSRRRRVVRGSSCTRGTTTSTCAWSTFAASSRTSPAAGTAHDSGLGVVHWPVEHTFAWLKNLRRPRIRTERRADTRHTILFLGCSIFCPRKLILN